jgi:hypothetical protein
MDEVTERRHDKLSVLAGSTDDMIPFDLYSLRWDNEAVYKIVVDCRKDLTVSYHRRK